MINRVTPTGPPFATVGIPRPFFAVPDAVAQASADEHPRNALFITVP